MLASNFKERYGNHKTSFRLNNRQNETKLSKHIWSLKDANKPFQIKWKIIRQWQPYSNIAKKCNLCLYEEFIIIICKKDLCSLKKCDKLGSSCLHRKRYILKNFKFHNYYQATTCIVYVASMRILPVFVITWWEWSLWLIRNNIVAIKQWITSKSGTISIII